jgi:hypothetical protein
MLVSTNAFEIGGLFVGLIITLLGYSIMDNQMDQNSTKKETIINGIRK